MLPGGWTRGALLFGIFCTVVLAVNLGVLIWAAKFRNDLTDDGTVVLRKGTDNDQCTNIQQLNKWAHLVINLLSTILLNGSNYCMQCLSAPTRSDVDSAHRAGRWLDIGVLSIRNLRWISRRRLFLWLLLGLSSLSLHLFYNSAVFVSTSSNNYAVFSVDRAFLESNQTSSFDYVDVSYILRSGIRPAGVEDEPSETIPEIASQLRDEANSNKLVNLTTEQCRTEYIKTFQSDHRNVLLVSDSNVGADVVDTATRVVSFLRAEFVSDFTCGGTQAFAWTCSMDGTALGPQDSCDLPCDDPQILKQTLSNSTWAPLGPPVQYCLAQPTQEQCSLRFSMDIAILVVVLNFVKLIMMGLTALTAFKRSDPPLLTMGDAVASFLENPDSVSKGMSLLSASKIKKLGRALLHDQASQRTTLYPGKARQRWSKAVSVRRWAICLLLYIGGLTAAAVFLGRGITAIVGSRSLSSLWSIGLGTPSGRTLMQNDAVEQSGKTALMASVVLANIPQLILSLLYFTYNGMFTCMLLASEWNSYSVRRKGLRISSSQREGVQRSGYYLQLPFRFSVPLTMASLLLHWLASQSIFVVNVSMLDYTGAPIASLPGTVGHLVTCGYSPIAIIFTISLGVLLIGVLLGFGFGARFRTGMPIAGSCSLAMAAACHSRDGDSAVAEVHDGGKMPTSASTPVPISQQPLRWGEIPGYYRRNDVSSTRPSLMNGEKSTPTPVVRSLSDGAPSDSDSDSDSNVDASLLPRSQTRPTAIEQGITETATSGQRLGSRRSSTTMPEPAVESDVTNANEDDNDNTADDEDGDGTRGAGASLLQPLDPRRRDDSGRSGDGEQDDDATRPPTDAGSLENADQSSARRYELASPRSGLGHCGFSASEVTDPVEGRAYA
ncbi:uncharacterized protein PV07_01937 [Cladophialophora immunda]|uniref:DUF6536 domain-containing protein n=1 Tax=Cladophialophora immunda TaxID=569365 RepID=A0A0D2A4I0_9EURO|nr:uncharacterized protein PV07_01937 [Cladophialophora immunda]KIW35231.1 hypothetical protein PV07_01937 [Cladophialophora immunda]